MYAATPYLSAEHQHVVGVPMIGSAVSIFSRTVRPNSDIVTSVSPHAVSHVL